MPSYPNRIVPVLLTILLASPCALRAQDSAAGHKDSSVEALGRSQMDIVDFISKLRKKSVKPREDSKPLHFSMVPAVGYTLQTGFAAVLSANLAYRANKTDSDARINSISTSVSYSQYNQIILPLQGIFWSRHNKWNIISDNRYLKYPSLTYGLGPTSSIHNGYSIDFSYVKVHLTALRRVAPNIYMGLGYFGDYFWRIKEKDPPAGGTDFEKYGITQTSNSSSVVGRALYDSRDNPINAGSGWYVNATFRPNFEFLGSDNDWQSLQVEVRRYLHLSPHSPNVLALWSYNWFTLGGKPPFLMLPSTGWDDFYNTGRGFIQGRYRDRQFVYGEAEYRFRITRRGLLGGVVFANVESIGPTLPQQISWLQPAAGAGLRIKLNKFSGANLAIDYGIGSNGSKGFFVNLGEVF